MAIGEHPMNRRALAAIVFSVGILLVGACSCPTSPQTNIMITPTNISIVAGAMRQFCASGTGGPYIWTLSGGGAIKTDNSLCATLTAGAKPGSFTITARSGDYTGTTTFTVFAGR